jgi:hypothetical protein
MPGISYSYGPGACYVDDWRAQWAAIFEVVAYAINFQANGMCWCRCTIAECDYCAHECPRGIARSYSGRIARRITR